MQITADEARALGPFTWLKKPAVDGPPAQRDPKVVERVSEMLPTIERNGLDAVRAYARELDGWTGDLEVPPPTCARAATRCPPTSATRSSSATSAPTASRPRSART